MFRCTDSSDSALPSSSFLCCSTSESIPSIVAERICFDRAYEAAPTQADRDTLRVTLTAARDAYWGAVHRGLSDKNEFVLSLAAELREQNQVLRAATKKLQDFVAFLTAAKEAVKLAAAIAALAAAA